MMRSASTVALGAIVFLVCLVERPASAATLAAVVQEREGDEAKTWPHRERVLASLAIDDREHAVSVVSALGAGVTRTLFGLYSGALFDERAARPDLVDVLREAVERLPAQRVIDQLVACRTADEALPACLARIEMIGWVRTDGCIPAIAGCIGTLHPTTLCSPRVHAVVRDAFARVLVTDPRRCAALAEILGALPAEIVPAAVAAAGASGSAEAARVYARAVKLGTVQRRAVMSEIARRGQHFVASAADEFERLARIALDDADPITRRLAAAGLGSLRDSDSFDALVRLLADEDVGLARAAGLALRQITGMERDWNAAQWFRWRDDELVWLQENAGAIGGALVGDDGAEAVRVLREASARPFLGERVVPLLARGYVNQDPRVRTLASEALRRLGHGSAVPLLIVSLQDEDEGVHAASVEALRALTKLDLGDDALAWTAWWYSIQ